MKYADKILAGKIVGSALILMGALGLVYTGTQLLKQAETNHDTYLFLKGFFSIWLAWCVAGCLPKSKDL
jgi:ABC-type transport system involved in multi-copper enzyme maturation permease subunit